MITKEQLLSSSLFLFATVSCIYNPRPATLLTKHDDVKK